MVLVMGAIEPVRPVLVRAHREYLPDDVFGYRKRNTLSLLQAAMGHIAAAGQGVILYLKREWDSLANDIDGSERRLAHRATTRFNAPEADFRDYGIGAHILRDVGARKMVLLTHRPPLLANLPGYGLEIVDHPPLSPAASLPLRHRSEF